MSKIEIILISLGEFVMKASSKKISIFWMVLCFSGLLMAYDWSTNSGTGSPENPYQIWTLQQLYAIRTIQYTQNLHFKLMADIDMSAGSGSLGSFDGVFDGNGHTVSNFTCVATYPIGLFSETMGAVIKNVNLYNVDVSGGNYAGGLVGVNCGTIENCHVSGSVSGVDCVGGLIGLNYIPFQLRDYQFSIINCSSDCNVVSTRGSVGGLIGQNGGDGHTIEGIDVLRCSASGSVNGGETYSDGHVYAGGLIGKHQSGAIQFCRFNGDVNVNGIYSNSYAGGLVGLNGDDDGYDLSRGRIRYCDVAGNINGNDCVGGLIGYHVGVKISHCNADCDVNGVKYVGGVAGYSRSGNIRFCSSKGAVQGVKYLGGMVGFANGCHIVKSYSSCLVDGGDRIGGLVGGFYYGTLVNCYATGSVSVSGNYAGGVVGSFSGSIQRSYAAVLISTGEDCCDVGGLAGASGGTITSCFWDVDVSGITAGVGSGESTGVYGKTTSEMKDLLTYTSENWEFNDDEGYPAVWKILSGDYPRLMWQPLPGTASYSGGDGTPNNPYRIATVEDFNDLTESPCDWSKAFILTSDIDLRGRVFSQSPIAPDRDNFHYGFQWTSFRGFFDGDGHTIRNLRIEAADHDYVGVFGRLAGGQIKNLRMENLDIHGRSYVGGLVGFCSYGRIDNCQTAGMVRGKDFVGGLAGFNSRSTLTCSNGCCSIEGSSSVGGIVGENGSGYIVHCLASNSVNLSGLSCYSYGGGLTGCNTGTIQSSYSEANVSAAGNDIFIGGIAGVQYSGDITSAYSTGSVSSDAISSNYSGGFAGYLSGGSVNYSYSTGAVTAKGESGSSGGFSGETDREIDIHSCFWDIESSGINYSSGGKGVNSQLMKELAVFQNAGWANKGWMIEDGVDSPRLAWEYTSGSPIPPAEICLEGEGTFREPYLIYTAEEFAMLSWQAAILDKKIKLMNDLDLSDVPLYPIGDLGSFTGQFDGNGYTLFNVKIHQPGSDYIGLFSKLKYEVIGKDNFAVYNYGRVKNLKVMYADIKGNDYVGGIAGASLGGTIESCSCSGVVTATGWYSGGLIGCFVTENILYPQIGNIWFSCSTCKVTGTEDVGGVAGHIESDYSSKGMFYSYSQGSVEGSCNVGGLVGLSDHARINQCYATGSVVGTENTVGGFIGNTSAWGDYVQSCFWNTQTSGQNVGVGIGSVSGIVGKATEEMKTRSTFASAGWNISEISNGSDGFWLTYEGIQYPKLWWQQHHLVADAGPDQATFAWVDGFAKVQLDGTRSYDEDFDALEYCWYNDANELIATGAEPNVVLGVGEHVIDLIVTDGIEDSEPNSCVVTVVEALQGRVAMLPRLLNRKRHGRYIIGWLTLPQGVTCADVNRDEPLLMLAGGAEIEPKRQHVLGGRRRHGGKVSILAYYDTQAILEAIPENGNVEIALATRLTTGRTVYGDDTMRIVEPRRKPKPRRRK